MQNSKKQKQETHKEHDTRRNIQVITRTVLAPLVVPTIMAADASSAQ